MNKYQIGKAQDNLMKEINSFGRGFSSKTYGELTWEIKDLTMNASKGNLPYAEGVSDTLLKQLNLFQEERTNKQRFFMCLSVSKYSIQITHFLEDRNAVTHGELTKLVGKSAPYFTKLANRLESLDLIRSSKIGREKHFMITPFGIEFLNYYRQNTQLLSTKDAVLIKQVDEDLMEEPIKRQNQVKIGSSIR